MKKAKIIGCLCIFICFICLTGCSSREKEYGDFTYIIINPKEMPAFIEITGLTDAGREKEVLIIPEEINGLKVEWISKPTPMWSIRIVDFTSENLKKLYLPTNLYTKDLYLDNCPLFEGAFVINTTVEDNLGNNRIADTDANVYIFQKIYFEKGELHWGDNVSPANVTYYYNFERADNNGCFWLDNIEQGEKIVYRPPTNPVRERYEFGGWYKEPECINKWDFENDVMPTTDGDTFYELKLYAKWL